MHEEESMSIETAECAQAAGIEVTSLSYHPARVFRKRVNHGISVFIVTAPAYNRQQPMPVQLDLDSG
jgi:hypothetical protein